MAKKKKAAAPPNPNEKLFTDHLWVATKVATLTARRLPACVEMDDLVQAGRIGLHDAVKRYEPSRGVPFATYAVWRVKGAILDWLRQNDVVPKSVRILQAKRRKAEQAIANTGEEATPEKVKASLKWTDVEYAMSIPKQTRQIGAMKRHHHFDEEHSRETSFDVSCSKDKELQSLELLDGVKGLLRHLPVDTFVVIYLYFWKGQTLQRIGDLFGLCESRISQIRSEGLQTLHKEGVAIREHFE